MKPRIGVYKFASCDGCQLAFLNMGEDLLRLAELVDIVHFAEAGPMNPDAEVDIAFVEGSVTTTEDERRIRLIRERSRHLVATGACATAGGIQALRNLAAVDDWKHAVYANPQYIESLDRSRPMSDYVKVDLELWGCPVNSHQVLSTIQSWMLGVVHAPQRDAVCLECKRQNHVCVLVARGMPCMGPVTQTGCGALCPGVQRDCYSCYGPAENPNTSALAARFANLGLNAEQIARRFLHINNAAPAFASEGKKQRGVP